MKINGRGGGAYRLLLHLQDCLVGIIETKEATKTWAQRLSGEPRKINVYQCLTETPSPGRKAAQSTLRIFKGSWHGDPHSELQVSNNKNLRTIHD